MCLASHLLLAASALSCAMATPVVVVQSGMGSLEDPCQEAAASNQSTEAGDDWELMEEAEESAEKKVDDLADHLKSMKGFATKVLEICRKCEIPSFKDACALLEEVCQSCDQQDRLIIAGSGNVGKSTIANAFLGPKFWPTASYCMTARICEAHYNAASDGKPISKELVQKSTSGEQEEQNPLKLFNPCPLLKSGVVLVDLPGLDQEKEYMEKLQEYMEAHPASSVVLFYVIDVNNKIRNPDRQFLEKLMDSPWIGLSQSLRLLVNKCDVEGVNGADSEEESPDYEKLLSDIKKEAQNYCKPKVFDLSMKDRKKHDAAVLKWQKVETDARSAIASLKAPRLREVVQFLEKVMDTFNQAADDENRQAQVEQKTAELDAAKTALQLLEDGKDENKKRRAEEIRQALIDKQDEHLDAIIAAGVPHWDTVVGEHSLREIDRFIADKVKVMMANDALLSASSSEVLADIAEKALNAHASRSWPSSLALALHRGGLVEFAVGVVASIIFQIYPNMHVDLNYVTERFDSFYNKIIEEFPAVESSAEVDYVVNQEIERMKEKEQCLADWRDETNLYGLLYAEIKEECSKLQEEFTSLKMLCEQTLGS